ncbi:MAG: flagellar biosynthetic protein FliQ [Hydrogenophilaceae bacterium]|nr:flagellar biosynthetic protein FliQ [Hydrogenophilaceae bacterium]
MEELFREALSLTFWIALPILAALLITALLMSVFQAATQILEPTLSFLPKALVLVAVLALLGAWMGGRLVEFARQVLESFPGLIQ